MFSVIVLIQTKAFTFFKYSTTIGRDLRRFAKIPEIRFVYVRGSATRARG